MQSPSLALCMMLLGVAMLGHACHGCIQLLEGCAQSYDTRNANIFCRNQDKTIACLRRIGCEPGYEFNREELVVQANIRKESHGCNSHGVRQGAAVFPVLAAVLISMAISRQA